MSDESASMERRVTRVESEVGQLRTDVAAIESKLNTTATKEDMKDLRLFFENRDKVSSDRMWWIVRVLIVIFGLVAIAAFGIDKTLDEVPDIFMK